ncbi:hypothetical protein [Mycolicibacterium komossense]|uniref:Uncharacterized protein n=1 Tax=Mycolicibacterium komossense TaxID=1779 RepID=A0ABT3CAL9_9MYCO|nr:hypothetical protein [Mycolicibacterium komossense]MCV7226523.1 hypothetical protein [Mycolicibacterium komossense]
MLDQGPDDAEEVVATLLNVVFPSAITRRNNDVLPFAIVRTLDGKEDVECGTADAVVNVRVVCDKRLGEVAAAVQCSNVHRQMLEQSQYLDDIVLASGRMASVDFVRVVSWDCPQFG